jgi:hypothetical protein
VDAYNETVFAFGSSDQLVLYNYQAGSFNARKTSSAVFRDPSAWYHIVVAWDTANATAADRVRLYVNGSRITSFSSSIDPAPNTTSAGINVNRSHRIGSRDNTVNYLLNGCLADVFFVDAQGLDPTSFGEFDTNGVWQPIEYTGTFGTTGFHLPFSDNSTAAALGTDTSSNGNTWTVNNISVGTTSVSVSSIVSGGFGDLAKAVDNSEVTFCSVKVGGPLVFDFSSIGGVSYSSSVVVRINTGSGSPMAFNINGAGYGSHSLYDGAQDVTIVSGSGTLNTLAIDVNAGGGANFHALKFDGNIFVIDPAGSDSLVDTPTNYGTGDSGGDVRGNFCTWSPLDAVVNSTLSNGNLDITNTGDGAQRIGSMGVSSGKWYYEFVQTVNASAQPGINSEREATTYATRLMYYVTGQKYNGPTGSAYGATWTTNDVIGIALDLDAGTLVFYKNGVSQGTAFTGLSGTWYPWVRVDTSGSVCVANFGQRPFAYPVSGYKAWCTTNLPEGTITTSGTFTGNASADGPFVYLNGVPTAMTINSNAVTFATHADKLSNGFKLRTSSGSYNTAGSNTYSITTTGAKFKFARAQPNP